MRDKNDFWQAIKILIMITALVLAILWALKVLDIMEAGLKILQIREGINIVR